MKPRGLFIFKYHGTLDNCEKSTERNLQKLVISKRKEKKKEEKLM